MSNVPEKEVDATRLCFTLGIIAAFLAAWIPEELIFRMAITSAIFLWASMVGYIMRNS